MIGSRIDHVTLSVRPNKQDLYCIIILSILQEALLGMSLPIRFSPSMATPLSTTSHVTRPSFRDAVCFLQARALDNRVNIYIALYRR